MIGLRGALPRLRGRWRARRQGEANPTCVCALCRDLVRGATSLRDRIVPFHTKESRQTWGPTNDYPCLPSASPARQRSTASAFDQSPTTNHVSLPLCGFARDFSAFGGPEAAVDFQIQPSI